MQRPIVVVRFELIYHLLTDSPSYSSRDYGLRSRASVDAHFAISQSQQQDHAVVTLNVTDTPLVHQLRCRSHDRCLIASTNSQDLRVQVCWCG